MAAAPRKASGGSTDAAQLRRRLNADTRRGLILKAARKAFSETGDASGTTIRTIADKAGISEGLIYRHFPSKEQLYIEAVFEPLKEVVDDLVETAEAMKEGDSLSLGSRHDLMNSLNLQLVKTFEEVLPLLGLVLFGNPKVARKFYRQDFAIALDRIADAWKSSEGRYNFDAENPDIAARAVIGMTLMLALESKYNPQFDRERGVAAITDAIIKAFMPTSRRRH